MLIHQFDVIWVLIVDRRYHAEQERLRAMIAQRGGTPHFFLEGQGLLIPEQVKPYDQISPVPPVGWRYPSQGYYHFRAIQGIIQRAQQVGARHVLVLEDDCVFTPEFDAVVAQATGQFQQFGIVWDLLYYGGNHSYATITMTSAHTMRVSGTFTTHCFAVRDTAYDAILALEPTDMIDVLFRAELHPKLRTYALWPNIAVQKPGQSIIWGKYTDYSDCFHVKGLPG